MLNLCQTITRAVSTLTTPEIRTVAHRAGLPWTTVYKIARGISTDPKWSTVFKLQLALGIPNVRLTKADHKRLRLDRVGPPPRLKPGRAPAAKVGSKGGAKAARAKRG